MHLTFNPRAHALVYQVQRNLETFDRVGDEALLRTVGPNGRLEGPERSLRRAHAAGELEVLGRWTLATASAQAARLADRGSRTPIAVNLSAGQLYRGLPGELAALLEGRGLDTGALVLELTEDQPLDQPGLDVLTELSERGFQLAVDDLGRDFANLDRLVLPVRWSQLKLDRGLVRRACDDAARASSAARAVVRHVAALGRELGCVVIAEGLESEHDIARVLSLGVTVGQGYGLGLPVPGPVVEEDVLLDGLTLSD